MQKNKTKLTHNKIANNLMYYIIHHIDTDLNIDEIANEMNVSKYHLHRIFKEQLNANIYETIKSVRLQKAANLLIANRDYTITEIGKMCGYSILTSFLRAFKSKFGQTPKQWRKEGYISHFNKITRDNKETFSNISDFSNLKPKISIIKDRRVYYIRHRGYDSISAQSAQEKLTVWAYTNNIENYNRIGVYYDNPAITPLDECYYVACIEPIDETPTNLNLPKSHIRRGTYAVFTFEGDYDDVLRLIQWSYHHWLPNSGYSTKTASSYCIFEENTSDDNHEIYKCQYHLPIL